ncbi:MAG TPA: hypothetical protein VMS56_14010 [Thermoanaerobaculia bacterium]|nr:hypothetical protein [Thermoanaerobaculia bacterium]
MTHRAVLALVFLLIASSSAAHAQITRIPGFFGRIFSDVEGYGYGAFRPLDADAPRGFGWNAALTMISEDELDGFGVSAGYGASSGTNPWRADFVYEKLDVDGAGSVNGYGVSGAYQFFAQEGIYAVNASGSVEHVSDAFNLFALAINGELRVPGTELSFGGSVGATSIDFDLGGSETDLTSAVEGIYTFRDYGFALSAVYLVESDLNDSAAGVTATWAIPPAFPLPGSNLRFGVVDDTVFVRFRIRI